MRTLLFVSATLAALLSPARAEETPAPARKQHRQALLRQLADEYTRELARRGEAEEEEFERKVKEHADDPALQEKWKEREEQEKKVALSRFSNGGPLDPKTPLARGENCLARLSWAAPGGEQSCTAVIAGATGATTLLLTRASCVADLSDPKAPRPRKLKAEFLFGKQHAAADRIVVQRIYPPFLAALAEGKAPADGSDLAMVVTAVPPPMGFAPIVLLSESDQGLRALAGKPLQVVGFGPKIRSPQRGATGRVADVERVCSDAPCDGRTNALLLEPDDARGACSPGDAGAAVTAFYPPQAFLVALGDGAPGPKGRCLAHPVGLPSAGPYRWLAESSLGNDFKVCTRNASGLPVDCHDSSWWLTR